MKKKVILGEEAKEQILEGAKILYDAVSTTLGPKGQNAVIEAYGEPIVTHDGVTVAKSIEIKDDNKPGIGVGIEMIKASSSKTNDNVGDGTTSSTILAYHLISEGMKLVTAGKNPMILRRELNDAAAEAINTLAKLAEPLKTEKATIEVATISSENKEIGKEVGHMYHVLGKDAMVAVEVGSKPVTEYEIVEGYTFDRGMASPLMVNDIRTQTAALHNPSVIIANGTASWRDVNTILGDIYQAGSDSVLIIAGEFKQDLLDQAVIQREKIEIVCVKAPGFGDQRIELLRDIAKLCGGEVVGDRQPRSLNQILPEDVGSLEKVVVSHSETILTGGQDVTEYIKNLETRLEATTGEFDKEKLQKRIAKLRSKVGQIRVGGHTEMEAEERKYLIDDAVAATEAALKDGIVPGGATTYVEISKRLSGDTDGVKILKEALLSPFKVLMTNSGERYGKKLEELTEYGKGFDVMGDGGLVDLKEHGIIDPALVIKQAITNATSVAGSALTTGVLIALEKEKDDKEEE